MSERDYKIVTHKKNVQVWYDLYVLGINKFIKKEKVKPFAKIYEYLEQFLPVDVFAKSEPLEISPLNFHFFCYCQLMLYTNGESIHDIIEKLLKHTGEKSFPLLIVRIAYHFKRIIFITESGKFYYAEGTYLGKDMEELCENVFEKKIGVQPYVCDKIYVTLKRQGWYKGRKADISRIRTEFSENGRELFPAAEKYFEEFSGIKINFWFGGYYSKRHIIGSMKRYIIPSLEERAHKIEKDMIYLGGEDEATYYIGRSGTFYVNLNSFTFSLGKDPYAFLTWLAME